MLQVNHSYAAKQLAKRAAKEQEEKEALQRRLNRKNRNRVESTATINQRKLREHLEYILEMSGIKYELVYLEQLMNEFKYIPLCDIKAHNIVKAYYKIERLDKYLIK